MTEAASARLLVVDDEIAQMQALCNTLKDYGYEAVGCTSGSAALAALREAPFDLLLADLMMPEMGGIDLLRSALSINPSLVGIIMTGEGTIATAVQAMQSGALDYILKPFKLSAILPVLSRALTVRTLRQENAALHERVRERSSELETANRELEAFSYSVSHDLRAPLQVIDGFAGALISKHASQLDEHARHYLDRIQAGTHQLSQIIDDLLRLSRPGQQPVTRRTVDVTQLVNSVLDELRQERVLPDGWATVVGAFPRTVADPALLRRVFVNLLSNACKFTRHQAQPRIEAGCESNGNEQIYFVRDNGAGFDMAYAEKLFTPFQRLHSASEFEGSGIGLSIVQRIVQRHGGRIWAEAAVGKGACFYFSLTAPASGDQG